MTPKWHPRQERVKKFWEAAEFLKKFGRAPIFLCNQNYWRWKLTSFFFWMCRESLKIQILWSRFAPKFFEKFPRRGRGLPFPTTGKSLRAKIFTWHPPEKPMVYVEWRAKPEHGPTAIREANKIRKKEAERIRHLRTDTTKSTRKSQNEVRRFFSMREGVERARQCSQNKRPTTSLVCKARPS